MAISPSPRYGHTLTTVGSHSLYLFGGLKPEQISEGSSTLYSTNEMYCFDTQKGVWTLVETADEHPRARAYHTATAVGTDLFVLGGDGKILKTCHIFHLKAWNLGTDRVVRVTSGPYDLWKFSTSKTTWTLIQNSTTSENLGMRSHTSMVSGGLSTDIFLFGGKGMAGDPLRGCPCASSFPNAQMLSRYFIVATGASVTRRTRRQVRLGISS